MSRSVCVLVGVLLLAFLASQAYSQMPSVALEDLVREAVKNNPEIAAAAAKWEAYRQRIPQASALEDPMLGFGIVNLPTNFSFRDEDMTMKEISVSQKLPFPGKRPLMREMAAKEADAASTEIQTKIHEIIRDIKNAYYELSHVYRNTDVVQRNRGILQDFAKIAETRYAVGEGIQQDLLKAHVEVSKMTDDLLMLDQRRKALDAKLRAILNRPSTAPLGAPEELTFRPFAANGDELQRMAAEMNPTLQGMKKMIEAKEKALALAKREYYPDFNLRFAYGQRDNGPDMKRRDMLTGMVEMNIPIFFGSKQDRKVAEAAADLRSSQAQYRAMANEVQSMVTNMFTMLQRLERQLDLYTTGILPQARLQVSSAMSSYRVSKADFMTLLDSQMTVYRYELEYHQALTEYEKSIAGLGAAMGKEFFDRGVPVK
jgi:outer membrane protein, heavy metal efflux system